MVHYDHAGGVTPPLQCITSLIRRAGVYLPPFFVNATLRQADWRGFEGYFAVREVGLLCEWL